MRDLPTRARRAGRPSRRPLGVLAAGSGAGIAGRTAAANASARAYFLEGIGVGEDSPAPASNRGVSRSTNARGMRSPSAMRIAAITPWHGSIGDVAESGIVVAGRVGLEVGESASRWTTARDARQHPRRPPRPRSWNDGGSGTARQSVACARASPRARGSAKSPEPWTIGNTRIRRADRAGSRQRWAGEASLVRPVRIEVSRGEDEGARISARFQSSSSVIRVVVLVVTVGVGRSASASGWSGSSAVEEEVAQAERQRVLSPHGCRACGSGPGSSRSAASSPRTQTSASRQAASLGHRVFGILRHALDGEPQQVDAVARREVELEFVGLLEELDGQARAVRLAREGEVVAAGSPSRRRGRGSRASASAGGARGCSREPRRSIRPRSW